MGSLSEVSAADITGKVQAQLCNGSLGDPVAALVTCAPTQTWLSVVNGRVLVEAGHFLPFELPPVIKRHNELSLGMIERGRSS